MTSGPGPPADGEPVPADREQPDGRSLAAPSAVLDEAHLGDIEGALGRIRLGELPAGRGWRRLITFLAIVGPGLIVMVGDNDAGGVATYAQAGQNYGYSLLWVLLLLIPVLIVNQEMVARRAGLAAAERQSWRMPPLTLLQPVTWSPGTKLGMALLRGYLVISVLLLVVKAVQLGSR
jgi:hypothetical protein